MRLRLWKVKVLKRRKKGQGITEYGAILAFVAVLVALVFAMTNSTLSDALSAAMSSIVSQINNLSSESATAS